MEHREHLDTPLPPIQLTSKLPDAFVPSQEVLRGRVAQGDDEQRSDKPDLGREPICTGIDLCPCRHTILRRAALDDVGDEHIVTLDLHRLQNLCELLASLADKRTPRPILGLPGALPDEHQIGLGMALSKHHVRTGIRQRALVTRKCILGQPLQAQLQSLPFYHSTPKAGDPSHQTLRHAWPQAQLPARRHRRTFVSPLHSTTTVRPG